MGVSYGLLCEDFHNLHHLGLLEPHLLHELTQVHGILLGELSHLHVYFVLLLGKVIGECGGVLTVAPFDVIGDIPLYLEFLRDLFSLVVDRPHPRGRLAFEDDVALLWIVAIADEAALFFLVGPVLLEFVVEVGGDDILATELAAGLGIGFQSFPDGIGVGEEVVRFG